MLRGRFPSEALRRAAFGAVAELAYLAGWKHHDLGQEGAAQRYYQVGYQLACEADPHGHAAWMMRALAHQALSLKQPHHCVDLVEGALARGLGHVDGQTEALLHITHARAYAAVGENPSAARALLAAEDALLRDDGPQPSYSRVSGPAAGTVASHTARTLTDLADHIGTEQQHRDALTRWDPEKYKRVHALTHADLGDSLAAQARADEAVAAWTQALVLMEGMTSDRTRKAITSIRSTLAIYQRRTRPRSRRSRPPSPRGTRLTCPTTRPTKGTTVAQQTDDQPKALKPALESMTLLVAAVIVHDKATNRVVLLQRSENAKFAQGMWDLPVGKSEPGEPITETAVRELYEETGLTVKPESLKVAHIIHGAWGVEAPNGFLTVVFAAHEWTGEPENREPAQALPGPLGRRRRHPRGVRGHHRQRPPPLLEQRLGGLLGRLGASMRITLIHL